MPRYFFNRVAGSRDPDASGLELPDLEHAKFEAITFAADTLKSDAYALWDGGEVRIEVVDHANVLMFTVLISMVSSPQ